MKEATPRRKQSLLNLDITFGSTGPTQIAILAKQLAVMLRAGLTLQESFVIARDSSRGKLTSILDQVLESITAGQKLSRALGDYPRVFSGLFVNAVRAGETSGTLVENLEQLAVQLNKEKELVAKIRGAMIYPIVVLVAAFFLGLGLAFFVLPQITPLFERLNVALPITTRIIIWVSKQIQANGIFIFSGIIGTITGFIILLKQKWMRPITHMILLRLPIIGPITRQTNLARFSRTLGTLLGSGLHIDEALSILRSTMGNYYYQHCVSTVEHFTTRGSKLSTNLDEYQWLFPKLVTRMVSVGEESGKLHETLIFLADYYEAELDTSTKSLATAIEPILLIGIGLFVGFLALSIITPIYEITGSVKR
ncbi:type II secretion system F family protein [Candidatus Uhrbacteria bacterium]|nr:type II secretion system F family protein [Candidatus Uhrbacteria bacterium]